MNTQKFDLVINDEPDGVFTIEVYDGETLIAVTGWKGRIFTYEDEKYGVFGPYHNLDGDDFRVYKLTPVSEAK